MNAIREKYRTSKFPKLEAVVIKAIPNQDNTFDYEQRKTLAYT